MGLSVWTANVLVGGGVVVVRTAGVVVRNLPPSFKGAAYRNPSPPLRNFCSRHAHTKRDNEAPGATCGILRARHAGDSPSNATPPGLSPPTRSARKSLLLGVGFLYSPVVATHDIFQ